MKVSHALRDEIGTDLFRHILRDQLRVDETTFWDVVRRRTAHRDQPTRPAPVPGWLVLRLLTTVGLPEDQVRSMSVEEALAAWNAFLARPR
jgi:hypothetical protein